MTAGREVRLDWTALSNLSLDEFFSSVLSTYIRFKVDCGIHHQSFDGVQQSTKLCGIVAHSPHLGNIKSLYC